MRVDWKAAKKLYLDTFGFPLEVKVCKAEVARFDDGERHLDRIIELLDRDDELSKGQLDCIHACSQED